MPRTTRKFRVVAAIAVVLGVLLLLSWLWKVELTPPGLRFQAGNGSVAPLFIMVTRGQLETNYQATATGVKFARVYYAHRFYCPMNWVQPVSVLRYWTSEALIWLRVPPNPASITKITIPTTTDTSVIWLGYRGTKSILEEAVLVSDSGLHLALSPGVGQTFRSSGEHLDCWKLPCLLTNRGTYRFTLPDRDQTLLTFVYEPNGSR